MKKFIITGLKGRKGQIGDVEFPGEKGAKGDKGSKGVIGLPGYRGERSNVPSDIFDRTFRGDKGNVNNSQYIFPHIFQ